MHVDLLGGRSESLRCWLSWRGCSWRTCRWEGHSICTIMMIEWNRVEGLLAELEGLQAADVQVA